jgi:hypothetical protein
LKRRLFLKRTEHLYGVSPGMIDIL